MISLSSPLLSSRPRPPPKRLRDGQQGSPKFLLVGGARVLSQEPLDPFRHVRHTLSLQRPDRSPVCSVTRMTRLSDIVRCDPDVLGGTPVFAGTRVPIQSLFDYLEGGETLDEFLRQFPSVKRDQTIAALDFARATLLAGARSS